jgi:hypothetical protein
MHFECSAFTGDNVDNIFNMMTKNILKRIEDGIVVLEENRPFVLPDPEPVPQPKPPCVYNC